MNLTLVELEAVVRELEERLVGGILQEARQPSPTALWLAVRKPGETLQLLFETAHRRARVHLVESRPKTLDPPPAFLCGIRADLVGSRFVAVDMPWPDRIAVFRMERGEARGALLLECSGHHPNLFQTDWEGRIVRALQASSSHRRELLPGTLYEPPPAGSKGEPELAESNRTEDGESPSASLDRHFTALETHDTWEALRRRSKAVLTRAIKRNDRAWQQARADLARAESLLANRPLGELLQANYFRILERADSIEVQDYNDPDGRSVVIPLRPEWTPKQNLDHYFKLYRKGRRGQEKAEERIEALQERAAALHALLYVLFEIREESEMVRVAQEVKALLPELAREFPAAGTPKRRAGGEPRLPYHEFTSTTGRAIRVGRASRDNHTLTFRHASPHDVWLHVRGFSGSHVVVPMARNQEPDHETLLDAAHLAIRFSKAPAAGFCEVMWTRRKHVRAVPKGAPGQVIVQQERNLSFDFEPARLARLMGREA